MKHQDTQCVHSGSENSSSKGINTPIYPSTAFNYLDGEVIYPRYFNAPNQNSVEGKIAALENGEAALLFSSGMAAISATILSFLNPGDHVIFQRDIYGGSLEFAHGELLRLGIHVSFVEGTTEAFERARKPETKMVLLETPSNPLLGITDLEKMNAWCQSYSIISLVDNTFASPINQKPLTFGIDLVVHSGTKYLGGHSDLMFGAVVGSNKYRDKILKCAINLGGNLNAQTCHLIERSLKTLSIRVERQTHNAGQIAAFLENHPQVKRVYYPGLKSHLGHDIAQAQMLGFGGMLSFETHRGERGNISLQKRLKLIQPAVSLGGIESTIGSSVLTSHAGVSETDRENLGISDKLLRLSVGIEYVEDLIEDLAQALAES